MRCLFGVALVAMVCSAVVAAAGPLDKNAGSKINGNAIGTPAPGPVARMNTGTATRSFSYAPAQATARAAVAPRATQQVPAPPVQQAAPRRSYSYSAQPTQRVQQARPTVQQPGYLRADRKARFEYGTH